jgi:hypothetical protein
MGLAMATDMEAVPHLEVTAKPAMAHTSLATQVSKILTGWFQVNSMMGPGGGAQRPGPLKSRLSG